YGEEGDFRRIDLSRNFRSRQQVIDSVNDIFGRIMSRECGGIVYDEKAMLYAGASYPVSEDCESELLLVEKPKSGAELSPRQAEALAIAQKIQELLKSYRVTDKVSGKLRPARYSDMVILLRTNSGWDEEFKAVLESRGIPAYISSKTGYFAASEVQELLNMLRVLNNPLQDIPLFGVLKSVFGGFEEEEIAIIRGQKKGVALYEALKAYGEAEACEETQKDEELRQRVEAFLKRLCAYRACTVYLPIRDLLQRLVEDYDYLSYVTALPGGGKRRANVEMLFTKASDFEKTSYFGLFHFIRYMEQLEKYDVDYGGADTLDENADVVRIMSIHKSKGLEFPITFVAGLSKRFNMQDANQSLIVDMDLGLATDYVDTKLRIRNKTLRRQALACKMREDNLAEELRVLYVAMTRAREKLILTAVLEEPANRLEALALSGGNKRERLNYLDLTEAGSYLDFLLPIVGNTRVRLQVKELAQLMGEELKEQVQLFDRKEALLHAAEYVDGEALERLKERFGRQYPYRFLEGLYTKTTVSELKLAAMCEKDETAFHAFEEKEVVPYIPAFCRKEETVTGAVRGNAYHKAMELLDFQGLLGEQFNSVPGQYQTFVEKLDTSKLRRALEGFLQRETEELRLPEEYYRAIQPGKILHFMKSELGFRMWRAQRENRLYREQPFVLGIEASRLKEEFPGEERVLIQGIIDVFFVEEDELVLLDYKTDVIQDMEALWNRYEVQIQYYEEALSRLMGMPVKEKLLYSFYLERCAGFAPQSGKFPRESV
ncbi:MAG: PD-(D/E)XK nuclease family protein, partial [Roseburia sp.]|nr:PD-(D/E)XK nuclease family protein [Roseburia sp.]